MMSSYVPVKTLRKKLTRIFNEFIRLRDKDKGCISCGGKVSHAGHYWPTSSDPKPSMRFNEMNVHGQCIRCNSFLEGNRENYRRGILKRYGQSVLDNLDIIRSLKQSPWTAFEYESMIKFYRMRK